MAQRLTPWLRRFRRDERGTITVWSLFLFIIAGAVGAVAVDVTHLFAARTELQVSADMAAHAALWRRNTGNRSAAAAQADAVSVVQYSMPVESLGEVIRTSDILFGTYDRATDTFRVNPSSKSAVLVTTHRDVSHDNPVATFLFRLAGIGQMDVSASAVAATYQPACLAQGFAAEQAIELGSNSTFNNFCLHSNGYQKFGNGNRFENGAQVSMPDLSQLQIGSSGLTQNPGLEQALREQEYQIRLLDRLRSTSADPIHTALLTPGDDDRPTYIALNSAVVDLGTGSSVTYSSRSQFTQNRVHTRMCSSSGNTLTISGPSGGMTYSNLVLITNCLVSLSGNVRLENVTIYTNNTSNTSVTVSTAGGGGGSSNGLWVGKNDNCGLGSGAQILTRGGFRNSAALFLYGAQIVALGPVQFASNATGQGAAVVTATTISSQSNLSFTGCPGSMDSQYESPYLHLVR